MKRTDVPHLSGCNPIRLITCGGGGFADAGNMLRAAAVLAAVLLLIAPLPAAVGPTPIAVHDSSDQHGRAVIQTAYHAFVFLEARGILLQGYSIQFANLEPNYHGLMVTKLALSSTREKVLEGFQSGRLGDADARILEHIMGADTTSSKVPELRIAAAAGTFDPCVVVECSDQAGNTECIEECHQIGARCAVDCLLECVWGGPGAGGCMAVCFTFCAIAYEVCLQGCNSDQLVCSHCDEAMSGTRQLAQLGQTGSALSPICMDPTNLPDVMSMSRSDTNPICVPVDAPRPDAICVIVGVVGHEESCTFHGGEAAPGSTDSAARGVRSTPSRRRSRSRTRAATSPSARTPT